MVSVIMPAYNAEKTIETAIESVVHQTEKDWELIVVDDGSTDNTKKIIEKYTDERIKYVYNNLEKGVSNSRNLGISKARGEWIAFLDSDDMWKPEKLAKQIKYARLYDSGFIFTGSGFMDSEGRILDYTMQVPSKVSYKELLKQNIISCSSVMIKKAYMVKYKMEASKMFHEDFAAWLAILKGEKIEALGINEPLLIYRVSSNSKSGNKFKAILMTLRTYWKSGIKSPMIFYYWCVYILRSLKKYSKIK